jgi:hypothetical protein
VASAGSIGQEMVTVAGTYPRLSALDAHRTMPLARYTVWVISNRVSLASIHAYPVLIKFLREYIGMGPFVGLLGWWLSGFCRSARMDQTAIRFDVNPDCKTVKQYQMFQVALYWADLEVATPRSDYN